MAENIYSPLTEYAKVYKDKFLSIANDTFQELAKAANVDVESNRNTCKEIYSLQKKSKKVSLKIIFLIVLYVVLGLGAIYAIGLFQDSSIVLATAIVVPAALLLFLLYPKLKRLKTEKKNIEENIIKRTGEAWEQMSALNNLYDWDIFSRMVAKTVPCIEFDPFFTTKRLADLVNTYGWDESYSSDQSVIYSHSGLINGNPFVLCRTRSMEWGEKTYRGSKTIFWTTRVKGSDGKYHTINHSQTLTAYITKPYPYFYEKTQLIYGNVSAPDLVFNRKKNSHRYKENSLISKVKFKSKLKELKNRTLDMTQNFVMSNNETFDVLFDSTDRNNSQQFFLLFTPLAQESMVDLIMDENEGYGDDFDFHKERMINTIVSDHIQSRTLDMSPEQFKNFDFDKAKELFIKVNADNFRAFYFCLAPLLCVPLYQQMRPASEIYGKDMPIQSSYWEHESLANFWGQERFKHPECETDCILKTTAKPIKDNVVNITVSAHGYKSETHSKYERVLGGDARYHNVRVEYKVFHKVIGSGTFNMCENTSTDSNDLDPVSRINHINDMIQLVGKNGVYRRHIASSM